MLKKVNTKQNKKKIIIFWKIKNKNLLKLDRKVINNLYYYLKKCKHRVQGKYPYHLFKK